MNTPLPQTLRTLLVLGRVSNVPTVWSNCLAGWILGGGGTWERLLALCFGATCLYIGGMYLNDAFDAGFDREHRKERPIPSGFISRDAVWQWGFGWLAAGTVVLVLLGPRTGALSAILLLSILVYDAIHKLVALAPVLMAGCRFFLILVAASAGWMGVTGPAVWSALALASYIIGLSYLAQRESNRGTVNTWPLAFLAAPLVLAGLINGPGHFIPSFAVAAILLLWILRCLRPLSRGDGPGVGRAVSGLLAGIALVDWLAIGSGASPVMSMIFAGLFATALLFQRFIPAT